MSSSADAFMGIFGFKRVEGGMKTDRELLELAAKAFFNDGPTHISNQGFMGWVRDCRGAWSPLTDDGDALRLAVKLNLLGWLTDEHGIGAAGMHGSDPYAATRRAIVRAAAAIGEQMA